MVCFWSFARVRFCLIMAKTREKNKCLFFTFWSKSLFQNSKMYIFLLFHLYKLFYYLSMLELVLCSVCSLDFCFFGFLFCLRAHAFNFGKFWTRNKPFILSGLNKFPQRPPPKEKKKKTIPKEDGQKIVLPSLIIHKVPCMRISWKKSPKKKNHEQIESNYLLKVILWGGKMCIWWFIDRFRNIWIYRKVSNRAPLPIDPPPVILLVHMWPPWPRKRQKVSHLFCELDP